AGFWCRSAPVVGCLCDVNHLRRCIPVAGGFGFCPRRRPRLCHRCHGKLVLLHPVGRQALTLGGGAEHGVFGVRFVPGRPYRRSKNPARLAGGTAVASTSLVGASLWHALSLAFVLSA